MVLALPVLEEESLEYDRPRTRGDCLPGGMNEARPCPFVTCRHHLYLLAIDNGTREVDVEQMNRTCVLDVVDDGGVEIDDMASASGLPKNRVQELLGRALRKLRRRPDVLHLRDW